LNTKSPKTYISFVQRQVEIDLRKYDRLKVLCDSLNSTLESYRKVVLEKDALISDQNSIINEQSAQKQILQIANINADRQILILSKQVRKNNRGKVFWKISAFVLAGSTVYFAVR
jgi:hypothetical protein